MVVVLLFNIENAGCKLQLSYAMALDHIWGSNAMWMLKMVHGLVMDTKTNKISLIKSLKGN